MSYELKQTILLEAEIAILRDRLKDLQAENIQLKTKLERKRIPSNRVWTTTVTKPYKLTNSL
jgi:hypothetical protein